MRFECKSEEVRPWLDWLLLKIIDMARELVRERDYCFDIICAAAEAGLDLI